MSTVERVMNHLKKKGKQAKAGRAGKKRKSIRC